MAAKVLALTRYPEKGGPGENLSEMSFVGGAGVEGDCYQGGGERQVSLLTAEARKWVAAQVEPGLCFGRFRENVLIEGAWPEGMASGGTIILGDDVVLRVAEAGKRCFSQCGLFAGGKHCLLKECAVFAAVAQGGAVKIGDKIQVQV